MSAYLSIRVPSQFDIVRTLRYSFVASCHSLVMVAGAGLAKARMVPKMAALTPRPITV